MKHPAAGDQRPALEPTIALKVDVDTFWGMRRGVPRLLDLFDNHDVAASFFVPMGKDHTGRTVKRVFTRPGFLSKTSRSGAIKTYGLKTLLYGILLPGPHIARNHGPLLREVVERGHELGIHGLDHVFWHDHIKHLGREKTEEILREAVDVYREILGIEPLSFAAPGWMINEHAFRFLERNGFRYSSDVRGEYPFLPVLKGSVCGLVQIPTTLPTLDEVVGLEGRDSRSLVKYFMGSLRKGLNVLTVHAELEGKHWVGFLDDFIRETLSAGFRFLRLVDIRDSLGDSADLPTREILFGQVRGRAGEVALQGAERSE